MTGQSSLLGTGIGNSERCGCSGSHRFQPGSTSRKYERSREFVVRHMFLDLELDFKAHSVSGSAHLDFVRRAHTATSLKLDALGFVIDRIELSTNDGETRELLSSEYSYDGDAIDVPLVPSVSHGHLTITYQATPRLGLYFLEPDKEVSDRPVQVWSQCQDEDGKYWFPCQDKPHVKMSYEMRVLVPQGMTVVSGGALLEKKTLDSRLRYHFRLDEPTPAYLVTLVVGKFDEWEENVTLASGREVKLRYLVPTGKLADGKRGFSGTAEAIKLFSEKTGVEYPYQSYTQVVVSDFIFGGMENTTATTMYEHILLDKTAALDMDSNDLMAHELAHHWFGDLVTCRDWSHAWLNEGFATYFEHIERQHRLGIDEYEHHVTADLNVYLGEAAGAYERAIVCRDYDEPIDLFDRHLYQKGGLVLHMLRRRLGDEAFFSGVKNYLTAHRGGIVETNDLMRALEETSGLSLERFFDEWVYRPGHPSLKITISLEKNLLTVDVEQQQKGDNVAVFELPFEIEVGLGKNRQRHQRLITERKSSLVVQLSERPTWINLDPEYLITAPIQLIAPADLLHGLLKGGPTARGRRLAALALGRRQDEKTVRELSSSLHNESEVWMVRGKAAESLGKIAGTSAETALITGLKTPNLKVQRAIADALGELRGDKTTAALMELTKSKSYLVTASAARSLGKQRSVQADKLLHQLLTRSSWADVVRAGALTGLSSEASEKTARLLLEWSRYGRPLRARRAALAALSQIAEGNKIRLALEEMLTDRDPHIRQAVLSALAAMGDARSQEAIGSLLDRELDGGVKSRAAQVLKSLAKDSNTGVKNLKEENLKLRHDVQALGRRLSKLEQQSQSLQQTKPEDQSDTSKSPPVKKVEPSKSVKAKAKVVTKGSKKTARKAENSRSSKRTKK